ncbi:hypothetical protein TWF281_010885 [Arthrobotrys megalospora]
MTRQVAIHYLRLFAGKSPGNIPSWAFELHNGARSSSGTIQDPFYGSSEQEEDLRWLLEEHPIMSPFEHARAARSKAAIEFYGSELHRQLQTAIMNVIPCEPKQERRLSIHLSISGNGDDYSVYSLHWETLELLPDYEFIVVRTIASQNLTLALQDGISISKDTGQDYNQIILPGIAPKTSNICNEGLGIDSSTQNPLRILFCTARDASLDDRDIPYRMISQIVHSIVSPLINHNQVEMNFVRPGTWKALNSHLDMKPPGYYQMVHLDVHGKVNENNAFIYLVSDKDPLSMTTYEASRLGKLFSDKKIPLVILNACKSAKSSSSLKTNLAATLVRQGIGCVIGMTFDLTVSSAPVIVPTLYQQLFRSRGDIVTAVYKTKNSLTKNPNRKGILGSEVSIPDSIVLAVYQNGERKFELWPTLPDTTSPGGPISDIKLSPETDTGVIGRDFDLLLLETYLASESHIVELVGASGEGKSVFLEHCAKWWKETGFVHSVLLLDKNYRPSSGKSLLEDLTEKISKDSGGGEAVEAQDQKHQKLIIFDDSVELLSSLAPQGSDELIDCLGAQKNIYAIFVTDGRPIFDLPICISHPLRRLSLATAAEIAVNLIKQNDQIKINFHNSRNHVYLERCIWLLGRNALAITLAFREFSHEDLYEFFKTLLETRSFSSFFKGLEEKSIMERVANLYNQSVNMAERLILLSIGLARLRLKRSPEHLIDALVSENLFERSSESEITPVAIASQYSKPNSSSYNYNFANGLFANILLAWLSPIAYFVFAIFSWKESERGPYDAGGAHHPCNYASKFKEIVTKLESEGLLYDRSMDTDYYHLHPLLPYCLTIVASRTKGKILERINRAFTESYRIMSKDWAIGDLPAVWSSGQNLFRDPNPARDVVCEDFASCLAVIQRTIAAGYSTWEAKFPWFIAIHLGAQFCTIRRVNVSQEEAMTVSDLIEEYLLEYERPTLFKLPITDFYIIQESLGKRQRVNGGAHMSGLTSCFLSMFLQRNPQTVANVNGSASMERQLTLIRLWTKFQKYQLVPLLFSSDHEVFEQNLVDCIRAQLYLGSFLNGLRAPMVEKLASQASRIHFEDYQHDPQDAPVLLNLDFTEFPSLVSAGFDEAAQYVYRKSTFRPQEVPKIGSFNGRYLGCVEGEQIRNSRGPLLGDAPLLTPLDCEIDELSVGDLVDAHSIGSSEIDELVGVSTQVTLGEKLLRQGEYSDAVCILDRAHRWISIEIEELRHLEPDILDIKMMVLRIKILLSIAFRAVGDLEQARSYLLDVREICRDSDMDSYYIHVLWISCSLLDELGEFHWLVDRPASNYDRETLFWFIWYAYYGYNRLLGIPRALEKRYLKASRGQPAYNATDILLRRWRGEGGSGIFLSIIYEHQIFKYGASWADREWRDSSSFVIDLLAENTEVSPDCIRSLLTAIHNAREHLGIRPVGSEAYDEETKAIFKEGESVLFGDIEHCKNFRYLCEYEGKPLRIYRPWVLNIEQAKDLLPLRFPEEAVSLIQRSLELEKFIPNEAEKEGPGARDKESVYQC